MIAYMRLNKVFGMIGHDGIVKGRTPEHTLVAWQLGNLVFKQIDETSLLKLLITLCFRDLIIWDSMYSNILISTWVAFHSSISKYRMRWDRFKAFYNKRHVGWLIKGETSRSQKVKT